MAHCFVWNSAIILFLVNHDAFSSFVLHENRVEFDSLDSVKVEVNSVVIEVNSMLIIHIGMNPDCITSHVIVIHITWHFAVKLTQKSKQNNSVKPQISVYLFTCTSKFGCFILVLCKRRDNEKPHKINENISITKFNPFLTEFVLFFSPYVLVSVWRIYFLFFALRFKNCTKIGVIFGLFSVFCFRRISDHDLQSR